MAEPIAKGKVRDIYDVGDQRFLIVATDRISAFDVILPTAIPDKGRVLTACSLHWYDKVADILPNHLLSVDRAEFPGPFDEDPELNGRTMLVRRARVIPMECVVRGYITGSGWSQYRKGGEVCGIPLPEGLVESDRLPEPIFTPTTKAAEGHDMPLTPQEARDLVGDGLYERLKEVSLAIYERIAAAALERGIIVADTKFEFGLVGQRHPARDVVLIDEVLTPDSSRFWPQSVYEPGHGQPSFDKQYVRDYLEEIRWNKQPPVPSLPDEVIRRTRDKYIEAFRLLTGRELQ